MRTANASYDGVEDREKSARCGLHHLLADACTVRNTDRTFTYAWAFTVDQRWTKSTVRTVAGKRLAESYKHSELLVLNIAIVFE